MSKEKQIEEMASVLCDNCAGNESPCRIAKSGKMCGVVQREAEALYNAGYRKQSEGEWIDVEDTFLYRYKCSLCGEIKLGKMTNFCPNCGAKMKGADNEK